LDKIPIVVADDDEMVRTYLVDVLDQAGYETLPASNGPAALDILVQRRDARALVTDIKMPLMDGFTLAQQARRSRPDLGVVYVSGYVDDAETVRAAVPGSSFLTKPFRPARLLDTMFALLAEGALDRHPDPAPCWSACGDQ
jgi:CheY-like chemotaxis protein